MLTLLIARGSLIVALAALLAVVASVSGCAGGGLLTASLTAPEPVLVSADSAPMATLGFRLEANVSAELAEGAVEVVVRPEGDADAGQVRVTVYRGELGGDVAPSDDVVRCGADGEVAVPRDALSGCQGECVERFDVVFAAEGLEPGETAELPVVVEAHAIYASTPEAPAQDTLALVLE